MTNRRRGTAAAETAVCLPLIVLVMLGSIELSSGISQQHRARAAIHELAKIASKGLNGGTEVQLAAQQMLGQQGIASFTINVDVETRTENVTSVQTPNVTNFVIDEGNAPTAGLDTLPRGTVLRMSLTAPRPDVTGLLSFLNTNITTDCVFVKEI